MHGEIVYSLNFRSFKPGDTKGKKLTGEDVETFWETLYHDRDIGELEILQKLFTSSTSK